MPAIIKQLVKLRLHGCIYYLKKVVSNIPATLYTQDWDSIRGAIDPVVQVMLKRPLGAKDIGY